MLKAVLDTNVIVSGLIAHGGSPYQVLQAWRQGAFLLFISPALLRELLGVLGRPFFRGRRGITDGDIARTRNLFETDAISVQPQVRLSVIKADPDDDRVFECALAGEVDFIVSGDKHLLSLERYKRIPIVTVINFLDALNQEGGSRSSDP